MIIPCYNEERRLPAADFQEFLQTSDAVDLHFVNDGSSDRTLSVLNRLKEEGKGRVGLLDLGENCGKAEAVRRAVLEIATDATYEFVGYFDADLATPLEEISLLLSYLKRKEQYEIAFGARVCRMGASIIRHAHRHYLGRVFSTFASLLLKLPVYDTQCGAKIMKRELARQIFADEFVSRWFFDVELFARIIKLYGMEKAKTVMIEVPLEAWEDKGGSKLKLRDCIVVPIELWKIRARYKI
ncbi:MAG: glycosyltransferase [Planctomycetota bacterium]